MSVVSSQLACLPRAWTAWNNFHNLNSMVAKLTTALAHVLVFFIYHLNFRVFPTVPLGWLGQSKRCDIKPSDPARLDAHNRQM